MSDKEKENLSDENREEDSNVRGFTLKDKSPKGVSSAEMLVESDGWIITDEMDEILELDPIDLSESKSREVLGKEECSDEEQENDEKEIDPIFKELAEPKLPELPKENRARLQMQSPTKLYFYWSVKNNPFQTLNKVFGGKTGSYTLVAKLVNKTQATEEIYRVEPDGNWWFDVDSDSEYRAEIGFYAPNRPYFRIVFSNEIRTPRKSPSKRKDYTPSFNVNANEFAEVLDVAGYQRDAFEVAFAGDDEAVADEATQKTYSKLAGNNAETFTDVNGDDLRFVLLSLASGHTFSEIRGEINPGFYNQIKDNAENWSSEDVLSALKENFDIFTDELFEEEEVGDSVFGSSIVNFPRRIRKRSVPRSLSPKLSDFDKLSKLSPISSGEIPTSSTNLR